MLSAYAAFAGLRSFGLPDKITSYAVAASVAAVVMLVEYFMPFRKDWGPGKKDFVTDALFLFFVQLMLPALLAFSFHSLVNTYDLRVEYWPSQWPLVIQTALMLVSAELLRYVMHRVAHEWAPLWKLHSIHHAPKKVYWLNTARFHPLEKSMQFFLDSLPFIFLGISQEVLGAYFVFYAVNGFFQHSNVDVRLGYLNYIISGPELHRWHHSVDVSEANHNYGNNLIVWDIVFGTWYLPKNREVSELGVEELNYEKESFWSLLCSPLKRLPKK